MRGREPTEEGRRARSARTIVRTRVCPVTLGPCDRSGTKTERSPDGYEAKRPCREVLAKTRLSGNHREESEMVGEFDTGAPTVQVNVYEDGQLIAQVACESAIEAAEVIADWEEREGVKCEVEDLAARHGANDVLAPEPEDAILDEPDAR